MFRFFHDGVCWLLSTVLLLTNGWPLVIQHAHDVGQDPYHHSHRFDRLSRDFEAVVVSDPDGAVAAVTEHVHLLWLGWEVTILPPKGGQPAPTPSDAAVASLAQVDSKTGAENGAMAQYFAELAVAFNGDSLAGSEVAHQSGPRRSLAALPLCDAARHLRSGVQLA
jgi:hypothetical protein